MIIAGGKRVTDVRVGRVGVEKVMAGNYLVWQRAPYLYLGSGQVWLGCEAGTADIAVWSNTEWAVEMDTLRVIPAEVTLDVSGGGEVAVVYPGEWEVRELRIEN